MQILWMINFLETYSPKKIDSVDFIYWLIVPERHLLDSNRFVTKMFLIWTTHGKCIPPHNIIDFKVFFSDNYADAIVTVPLHYIPRVGAYKGRPKAPSRRRATQMENRGAAPDVLDSRYFASQT